MLSGHEGYVVEFWKDFFCLFQSSRNPQCPDDHMPIFVDGRSAANLAHFRGLIYLGHMILKVLFSKNTAKLTKSSLPI